MIFTDKAAKEKISSLESRVSELEADIVTKDEAIESHAAEITAKDQTIAEHVASIASRDESITALTTEKESLTASITAKDGEIATLKAEVETAKASAGKLATEQLAAIGQPEALNIDENGGQPVDHVAVLASLKGAERTAYYNLHAAEIKAALKQ